MFFSNEILVVDSHTHTLRIVKDALLKNGFVVHFAHNCELAIQLAIRNKPELILSEVALEDMDGREFMRMVQNTPEVSQVPFIFLTSRSLITEKISALDAGADDYITKPFNENELVARIRAVLRRTHKTRIATLIRDDGIKGNLKDISLLDLIQLFDMGRKTAVIQVEGMGKEGRVYFDGGEMVHAVCGKLFGKEAVFEILSIPDGTFLIHLHISSKIRTIDASPMSVAMEAMHRLDQERASQAEHEPKDRTQVLEHEYLNSEGIKELFGKGVIEECQDR